VAKFCFGVYSGEAKGSVLAPCVTLVCCWFIQPALSSLIYFVSKKFHNCVIFYCVV
jgi:hypothetical protein